ncbi:hypothetical protein NST89_15750 [Caldifermentibacillus hisashii]|uniref:hypothetical protein n=1 Tax=Caldifermentibacillus hisashii TaxID=996558 RepID=UPI003135BD95
MIVLNLLFVLLLLTTLARYIVFDAFDPLMFEMIFLLPIVSVVIFLISKRLAAKESSYQPKNIEGWSFYNIQKSLMNRKPLFKGEELRGYVKRYFPKKWQYFIGDILGFNWYLSLEIQINKDIYDVQWYREKWFSQQDQWIIYKNGERIGEARTLMNLKNAAKLKEAIQFSFYDKLYKSSAITVTSGISLTQGEKLIGTLKPNHIISNVQVIDVQENQPEYIVALIIHSFYFKSK